MPESTGINKGKITKKKEKFSDFFISLSILYKYLAENLYFIDHKYLFLAVTPSYNKEKHLNRS